MVTNSNFIVMPNKKNYTWCPTIQESTNSVSEHSFRLTWEHFLEFQNHVGILKKIQGALPHLSFCASAHHLGRNDWLVAALRQGFPSARNIFLLTLVLPTWILSFKTQLMHCLLKEIVQVVKSELVTPWVLRTFCSLSWIYQTV